MMEIFVIKKEAVDANGLSILFKENKVVFSISELDSMVNSHLSYDQCKELLNILKEKVKDAD